MFTQRRCTECECRNGEIRCEEAETCGQAGCAGPEYLCGKGESVITLLRTGELSLFLSWLILSKFPENSIAMKCLMSMSGSVFGTGSIRALAFRP